VNNTFGHKTGDDVLVGFAQLWKEGAGKSGLACRWGGEELAILLPDTDEQKALEVAETLRRTIQDHVFLADDDREVRVTISTGVALFPRDAQDIVELVKMADRAQYLAKRSGKNRVCLYTDRKELIEEREVQPAVPEPVVQE
jgi:diguanylate cyclase